MSCQVRGCVVKPWGHFDAKGTPHAPTELQVCTGKCLERCRCGKPCGKYNGHDWFCNCHVGACHVGACHAERGEKALR